MQVSELRSVKKFDEKMQGSSVEVLNGFVLNADRYQDGFVLAALLELERRKEISNENSMQLIRLRQEVAARYESNNRKKDSSFIPKALPQSIRMAAGLIYSAAIIAASIYLVGISVTFTFNGLMVPTVIFTLLVGILVHKGSNWARWMFVVFLALEIAFEFSILGMVSQAWLSWISVGLKLAAAYLLFNSASTQWYAAQKEKQRPPE